VQSLKDIRRRIDTARGTQKVTRAMKLVAAAKLRGVQDRALAGRSYSSAIYDSVTRVSKRLGVRAPGLWRRPLSLDLIDVIVLTSDRGLCGGFNENLLRSLEDGIEDHITHNIGVKIYAVGRKGYKYLKQRGYDVEQLDLDGDREAAIDRVVEMMCDRYLRRESSGCNLGFNKFVSAARQRATFWNMLPLYHIGDRTERFQEYEYEPGRDEALDAIAKESLRSAMRQALAESTASEQAARMVAMDGATKNADDMIAHLTYVYNKARQEAITTELMDIVNGAEALR
jgi:F-type H+-transporting ATPase subunit gamma